jgi:hypothetical protein
MSLDGRLDKLMPVLSAKERGILVLKALKDRTDEDPSWRTMAPIAQWDEFNRFIRLMNACNVELAFFITLQEQLVEKQELRLGWLTTLYLWQMHLQDLRWQAWQIMREPITESEHAALVSQERELMVPVGELSEILTEQYDGWTDADYETLAGSSTSGLRDTAWDRVDRDKTRELRALVAQGTLLGKGGARQLKISQGDFYDWLGQTVPVFPEEVEAFEVRPDSDAAEVRRSRTRQEKFLSSLRSTCLDQGESGLNGAPGSGIEALSDRLEAEIRSGIELRWRQLRAIELVLDEVAAEFDGEDVLRPEHRATLNTAKAGVEAINLFLATHHKAAVELVEPEEQLLDETRALIEKAAK